MKRLTAPKHWMLDKLGGVFVSNSCIYYVKHVIANVMIKGSSMV